MTKTGEIAWTKCRDVFWGIRVSYQEGSMRDFCTTVCVEPRLLHGDKAAFTLCWPASGFTSVVFVWTRESVIVFSAAPLSWKFRDALPSG
ncbi:hypothetical protein RRG08_014246 [Elysia crispata]|uniref:Uncharacterized protein n=1 Tax=Elysia crispata TaxID=231223 RepID=A0AAE0XEG9_9GAST|nr:hypothetical protein RRG08_014246 [Elysia crispata]